MSDLSLRTLNLISEFMHVVNAVVENPKLATEIAKSAAAGAQLQEAEAAKYKEAQDTIAKAAQIVAAQTKRDNELLAKAAELDKRDSDLDAVNESLLTAEENVKAKEKELADRETKIAAAEGLVTKRKSELARTEAMLMERESMVKKREEIADNRDKAHKEFIAKVGV